MQRSPLERLLSPISPPVVRDLAGSNGPAWLHASGGWRLFARPGTDSGVGEEIEGFSTDDGTTLFARVAPDTGNVTVPFNLSEAYDSCVYERWIAAGGLVALSAGQLDLYYRVKRFIPRKLQLRIRRLLTRVQDDADFPMWPLDENLYSLLRFYAKCLLIASEKPEIQFRWFWPNGYRGAMILTHDVESAEGIRASVDLADLEEERGLRSVFNIVADWYEIDWGVVRELSERGFEFGVHGVHHDRSMFASRAAFESQLPAVRAMAGRLGAVGFRSPAMHRVVDWLGDLPVSYDCSVPHSDPFEPQPGGCCSLWPYFIGDVVELPTTMPQDHLLFSVLGQRSIDVWSRQVERIVNMNGMAQILTHPDPGYLAEPWKRALYVEFLELVKDCSTLWHALPRDVAAWWRVRDGADADDSDDRLTFGVARAAENGDVVFVPPNAQIPQP